MAHVEDDDLPIIQNKEDFDTSTGTFMERMVFNNRAAIAIACAIVTLVLGYQAATKLTLQAGFEKMLPKSHEYVINYKKEAHNLKGLGNTLRLVISTTEGDIWSKEFLDLMEKVNDDVFFVPGVDRSGMKSIWTPNVRWLTVTEEGFEGGPVIPAGFDGSEEKIRQLKLNVMRASITGDLIANNGKSAAILVPLLDFDPKTGERLNYYTFTQKLEKIREHYSQSSDDPDDPRSKYEAGEISLHIVGFAKVIGELIDGLFAVMGFFAAAVLIAWCLLYWYTRCWRSTSTVIFVTIVGVTWQLGILATLGYELDPFSILVPFLVFAIGVSHGAQKLNGVIQDIAKGTHPYIAARFTFRRLFLAGVTALLSDGVGFAVLMIIQIQVIQDLAITASIGVLVLIFTNLILIPIVLSYTGVCDKAVKRSIDSNMTLDDMPGWIAFLLKFTERRWAIGAIIGGLFFAGIGIIGANNIQIGDLDKGAPELRPDSVYNKDVDFVVSNYSVSSDIFAVIVKTEEEQCANYEVMKLAEELEWRLRHLPVVEQVYGLHSAIRRNMSGMNEGYIKFHSIYRNQDTINNGVTNALSLKIVNPACSVWPLMIYLSDHKAATLKSVVNVFDQFNVEFPSSKVEFIGAAGSAGFEAATNVVVEKANREMMFYVYGAVLTLCMLTFRSVAAVLCAVLPLMVTSVLCEALMVVLGMGIKVATLPVIALGVGIGVDYALYILTVILAKTRAGVPLREAYFFTLNFTGRVVALIAVTLAAGVITWAWSPIKFQADMGILLTFMFLWNMVGAMILMPALGVFLLPIGDKKDKA
jgi:predicted RND superfamily exporter protein